MGRGPGALTREQIDGVADRIAAGERNGAIGLALGLSRNSVAGIISRLRKRGDPRVPAARASIVRTKAAERDALAEAFANGATSVVEAARIADMSEAVAGIRWREICATLGWQAR